MKLITDGKVAVEPSAIERELMRIWRETADSGNAESAAATTARVRATLSNTVIFTAGESSEFVEQILDPLITELCIHYPSRFFIIGYYPEGLQGTSEEGGLKTAVSSRCVKTNSGTNVCSEEVYISCSPQSAAVVPNLLTSHLVPDVHSILVMLGDPIKEIVSQPGSENAEKLLRGIGTECERLIYDSALVDDYLHTIAYLESIAPFVRDLNWNRTKRWQMLIAEQFDTERFASAVGDISKVQFYSSVPPSKVLDGVIPGDTLLLAGWILTSLSWEALQCSKLKARSCAVVSCNASSGYSPTLEFYGSESANTVDDGALEKVVFTLTIDDENVQFSIAREPGTDSAEVEVRSGGNSEVEPNAGRRVSVKNMPLEQIVQKNILSDAGKSEFGKVLRHSMTLAKLTNG